MRPPLFGVIFIQRDARAEGPHWSPDSLGGPDWIVGCGDDSQDTPGLIFPWEADQGDLPGPACVPESRQEGDPIGRDRVSLRTLDAATP